MCSQRNNALQKTVLLHNLGVPKFINLEFVLTHQSVVLNFLSIFIGWICGNSFPSWHWKSIKYTSHFKCWPKCCKFCYFGLFYKKMWRVLITSPSAHTEWGSICDPRRPWSHQLSLCHHVRKPTKSICPQYLYLWWYSSLGWWHSWQRFFYELKSFLLSLSNASNYIKESIEDLNYVGC